MTGDLSPPAANPPAVRAALAELGEVLASLRERLAEVGEAPSREPVADQDEHALGIFQEILSLPPLGLPPGELFGLAMDRLSRLLAADRVLLFVLDETTGRLVPRSGRGFRREDMESTALDPGEGLVGRVFKEKRVLTYDAGAEPAGADAFVERFPVRQAIAVPVRTEGEAGGVLFAGRRALGAPFSTTDVLLLLVIADRVGSALVHQRLLEQQGDHLAHLRELRGLADALRSARAPREILARAADAGCRLTAVRAALALAGSGPADVQAVAGAGALARVEADRIGAGGGLLAWSFASDGPVAVRDLRGPATPGQTRGPARTGVLEDEGLRGVLIVPMRARGRVVGLLALADPEARDFSPEQLEAAQMLAAVTAGALEAQRMREETRLALAEQSARDAERALREQARTLVAFGAGLTRELNSVFAVLLGKSQLLLARAQSDPLREGLAALEEAAWRGTDVLQRLLGLAEAEPRGGARCDLTAIAHEAVGVTRARVPKDPDGRGWVEMVADLAPTPPVEGSATALREAIINLVLNALQAMPDGGSVTVCTREQGDGAELVVADTGPGIPVDVQPRIFDPFFTTRPGHLGLGLFVVRAVVLRAGGHLDVRSAEGGTTVTMWLPAAVPAAERPGADTPAHALPEAPAPAERTAAVLVVEEEEGIRTAVLDALMAVGHRVETAADAAAALERLGQGGIEVVLTDLALRDRSGLQLAAAVKERCPEVAVVLMTGWGRRLHEDRVREAGVDVMLVKPVQADRVRAAVADALRARRPA
jgi:signal transduction histidine kinase/ActR/RegA family two-component response regulator